MIAGLAVAVALMTLAWVASVAKRDASIVDPLWGPGFAAVAWTYRLAGDGGARGLLVAVLVTLWGARLGGYLSWRKWGEPEDRRYAAMRANNPAAFPWTSLATVFWLQAVILWIVAMPLYAAQRAQAAPLDFADAPAVLLFLVGFAFETVGDVQLARFKADSGNRGKVLDGGLWRYTRHPNYFGDALAWWGLGLLGVRAPGAWWVLLGPALMTVLLLKVSGVTLLERDIAERRPAYRDYVRRTAAFFPRPPRARDGGSGR